MTTTVYHISPKLGPKKCSVTTGVCRYPASKHFENSREAQREYENFLKKELDDFHTVSAVTRFKSEIGSSVSLIDLVDSSNKSVVTSGIFWGDDTEEMDASQDGKNVELATTNRIKEALAREKVITRHMVDSLPENAHLDSLEFRVKSPKSLSRKISNRAKVMKGGWESRPPLI